MKNTTLTIQGMSCVSCVADIEATLGKVPGVSKVQVNFANSTAHIMHDPSLKEESLIAAVASTGYTALSKTSNEGQHGHHDHAAMESAKQTTRRLQKVVFGGIVSIILISLDFLLTIPLEGIISLTLTTLVLLFTSSEFYKKGLPSFLKRGRPNMDTLVAIGISSAFLFSTYTVFYTTSSHYYFMDVAVISTLVMLGRYLEAKSKGKANQAMKKLLELGAKVAHKNIKNTIVDIPVSEVQKGDTLTVKPGEKVPVDGTILEGNPIIDESMVTGESIPMDKKPKDHVIGATINSTSTFTMKATGVGEHTLLAQMAKLIEEAQLNKAPIQKLVDTISKYFVWTVLAISIITLATWWSITGQFEPAIIATVAVLIIACPCALGLATPISLVVGSGKGAEHGILIKDASALEKVEKIDTICFDKTGTITQGKPRVTHIKYIDSNMAEDDTLQLLASLEHLSEHPLATAVVNVATDKNIPFVEGKNVTTTTGGGITGSIGGYEVAIGNVAYISPQLSLKEQTTLEDLGDDYMKKGHTVVYFSINNKLSGYIAMQDTATPGVEKIIKELQHTGIRTVMLTGDNQSVATSIAKEVGIDEVHAGLKPKDKIAIIKDLQNMGRTVAMVGDGINDAPALATADIGIAMGTGTDIAIESGDLVLIKGDLHKAVQAITLSKATMKNIKQNLFWAFMYNTIGIPVAALGLLNPIFSAFAMGLSSISVVLNALRLRNTKL